MKRDEIWITDMGIARPTEVERRLGHRDWVMSVPEEQMPRQRWERMKKLGEFSFARHASWMGF